MYATTCIIVITAYRMAILTFFGSKVCIRMPEMLPQDIIVKILEDLSVNIVLLLKNHPKVGTSK